MHILRLEKILPQGPDAVSLHFPQPKFGRIHYKPGQYLSLKLEIAGQFHFRSYSLSSAPRLDQELVVVVKRVPGGLVSNYINDHFKPGQMVETLEPGGHFFLETAIKYERHLTLFAAGSGITPIFSMLRSVLYIEPRSKVSLVYANSQAENIIFKAELDLLEERFPERCKVWHLLSQEKTAYSQERLSQENFGHRWAEVLQFGQLPEQVFLCGPPGFMDTVEKGLNDLNYPAEQRHKEAFVAEEEQKRIQERDYSGPTRMVTVTMGEETWEFPVPAGMTILNAALEQGLNLPHSCKRGICSSCMATLEQGQVAIADEKNLLDFEREQQKILMCQAMPLDDEVSVRPGFTF
ncbi:MAG: ferredoxin--NADP reductase [Bacteroidota bacterium]